MILICSTLEMKQLKYLFLNTHPPFCLYSFRSKSGSNEDQIILSNRKINSQSYKQSNTVRVGQIFRDLQEFLNQWFFWKETHLFKDEVCHRIVKKDLLIQTGNFWWYDSSFWYAFGIKHTLCKYVCSTINSILIKTQQHKYHQLCIKVPAWQWFTPKCFISATCKMKMCFN